MCVCNSRISTQPLPFGQKRWSASGWGSDVGDASHVQVYVIGTTSPGRGVHGIVEIGREGNFIRWPENIKTNYWVNCPPNWNNKDEICTLEFGYPECFWSSSCR